MIIPTSNPSKTETDFCRHIYLQSRADSRMRSEITGGSHPSIWPFVKDLSKDTKVFVFDQNKALHYALLHWGITMDNAKKKIMPNDYCRFISILLSADFRDCLNALQKKKPANKHHNRHIFDDPKFKANNIFALILETFTNPNYTALSPKEWETVVSVGSVGYDGKPMGDIYPNDTT